MLVLVLETEAVGTTDGDVRPFAFTITRPDGG